MRGWVARGKREDGALEEGSERWEVCWRRGVEGKWGMEKGRSRRELKGEGWERWMDKRGKSSRWGWEREESVGRFLDASEKDEGEGRVGDWSDVCRDP